MRDQDRWSIQNGAIEIEEGVLHLSVVRGRETRRLNVEIKNLKIVTSDDVRIRIDTPVGQLTISADKFVTPEEYARFSGGIDWCRLQARGVIHRLEGLLNRYLFLGLSSKYLAEPFFCFIFAVTKAEYSHRINDISRDGAVGARRAHNPKVGGSSPPPATKVDNSLELSTFFILMIFNGNEV